MMLIDALIPSSLVLHYGIPLLMVVIILFVLALFIPVKKYEIPIQVILMCSAAFILYQFGVATESQRWEIKISEAQNKVLEIQIESNEATEKIRDEMQEKINELQSRKPVVVRDYIQPGKVQMCKIPKGFDQIYDADIKGKLPPPVNETTDDVSDTDLLDILGVNRLNMLNYEQTREQLKFLQRWINEQKEIYDKK